MKRVLVTGARGFAGRWLVKALEQAGHAVVSWGREVDLGRPVAVATAVASLGHVDWAFHLGAIADPRAASADPAMANRVNVGGTAALAAELPRTCRIILASSCHVYGRPARLPIQEDDALSPEGVYAQTKAEAEQVLMACRPDSIIARAFHHVGPGQDPRYALAGWVAQLRARPKGPVRVGDLSLRRDITDVRDVVDGYIRLADVAPPGSVVNLCSGESPPLSHWLAELAPGVPVHVQEALLHPGQVPEIRGCPTQAHALGWYPRHKVVDTLRQMLSLGERP